MKNRQSKSLFIAIIIFSILGINIIAHRYFSGIGIDLSADRIFTLNRDTNNLVANLKTPTVFEFYYSEDAAKQDPPVRAHAQRVRDLLRQFESKSDGKILLKEINVLQFSNEEDAAIQFGLIPFKDNQLVLEPIYLGLVVKNADQTNIIEVFDPADEANIEYKIAKTLIQNSNKGANSPDIALITAQDWFVANKNNQGFPISQIAQSLAAENNIANLGRDFTQIPSSIQLVIIISPWDLTDAQQFALDQFVVGGGKVIVCLDPYSNISADNGIGLKTYNQALGRLEKSWGIVFSNELVGDKNNALPVRTNVNGREIIAPQPLIFNLSFNKMSTQMPFLTGLKGGINFATPSYLIPPKLNGVTFTPFLQTSIDAMRLGVEVAATNRSPQDIIADWSAENRSFVIGALLKGRFVSAFDGGLNGASFIKSGTKEGGVFVIADSDFLADSLYLNDGKEAADNMAFFLNLVDYAKGELGLLNIRAKSPIRRNLFVLEDLRSNAQSAILTRESQLNQQLETLNQKLETDYRLNGGGNNDVILQKEILDLRNQIINTRRELRDLKNGVRQKINGVKAIIIGICAILIPLALLLFGLFGYFARQNGRLRGQ